MGLRYKKYSLKRGVYSVKTKSAIILSSVGLLLGSGGGLALTNFGSANAAVSTNYTLFGAATNVSGGNPGGAVQMVSNTGNLDTTDDFGGIDYTGQTGGTLANLTTLSTDYEITAGDCGGGSPRFQLNIGGHNVFVYIGPAPNFTGCTVGSWQSTGNLVTSSDARFDTSQYAGGSQVSTYAQAVALLGAQTITGVQLVTDGGWAVGGNQTVLADNTQINDTTFTYEPASVPNKDSCKNNGWKTMTDANGRKFKNQGDCVSYFATNGKNTANG